MTALADVVLALHRALRTAGLPYAFGGALALGWCTRDPRATSDVDLNIFVGTAEVDRVLAALPAQVDTPPERVRMLARDGQVRFRWGETPVDIFLVNTEFHAGVAGRCQRHLFGGEEIPYLCCADLAVFKAFFDRTKDWADLEEMAVAGSIDIHQTAVVLVELLGAEDARVARMRRLPGRPTA